MTNKILKSAPHPTLFLSQANDMKQSQWSLTGSHPTRMQIVPTHSVLHASRQHVGMIRSSVAVHQATVMIIMHNKR